ncbi:hypothetical protein [Caproicibacterium sp. BJN0003]|uniref:hypothetical protein n=1 Tax=Caproicibacterium sp. BJN0003 TaxID=2994078 RepID=UPI002258522E|nr:hypothetical protein [Caproicibacterium sp. BJN0003]UZT81258.1 hypothetical protein OP489_06990 [Caproicibacterium sp. BJN0003]
MTNNKKSASAAATAQGTKQKVFRNENTTIPEETQDLYRIISDLDDCGIKFEQEKDTFSLILEDLEDSVNGSNLGRALMDVSSLTLIYDSFYDSLKTYQELISAAYDRYHLEVPRED